MSISSYPYFRCIISGLESISYQCNVDTYRCISGMRVGDKRRLTIPPQMAYGAKGVPGTIPGNAWLTFDVELVNVK